MAKVNRLLLNRKMKAMTNEELFTDRIIKNTSRASSKVNAGPWVERSR